ncbi:hypothetical protein [Streptomyces sp. NPDC002588]|uniref:hypothetical protein n=1 Tax=Streptomyces sp. NPDC002588 TaxID=3154419 RepID=UPI003316DCA5
MARMLARPTLAMNSTPRLDHRADLGEIFQEAVGRGAVALPAQQVTVEQVPVGAGPDGRTALLLRLQQALGAQHGISAGRF